MHTINTQMFRAHLKAHTRLLAFSLNGETPTHERIAVQNMQLKQLISALLTGLLQQIFNCEYQFSLINCGINRVVIVI